MAGAKRIYVLGHRNPDTDSIVSAIAYADLKRSLGFDNCIAARAGKLNPQTEYILNRFNFTAPEFVSNLIPKVSNYMSDRPVTISHDTPLWHALKILDSNNYKMLPVVDSGNRYISSLHYNAFALNMINKIDPVKKSIIPTTVSHLIKTLDAEPAVLKDEDSLFHGRIVIAAYDIDSFKEHIAPLPHENCILITGDRPDIQKYAVEIGVRVLIVTGGSRVDPEIRNAAKNRGVSLVISSYDTSTTSWLALNSTPVREMGDSGVRPVKSDDFIRDIRDQFADSVSKSLTVVDNEGRVIGVITHGDLLSEPNIEIIMVDHNEISQSLEGIENFRILEIIDHHRLGNIHTAYPITFINRPVGSTSTIIAGLYIDHGVDVPESIAALLLGGILSDTLILQSTTTTELDISTASKLADKTGLSISDFGKDIMHAASLISKKPAAEILGMDMKEFVHDGREFSVSQVEVSSPDEIMVRSEDILAEIETIRSKKNLFFTALMVTDISALNSHLFIRGDENFIKGIGFHRTGDGIYDMPGILSRKKQLLPFLIELMKKK